MLAVSPSMWLNNAVLEGLGDVGRLLLNPILRGLAKLKLPGVFETGCVLVM
jgi:hypothetical protein